jgi:hypothetical protein
MEFIGCTIRVGCIVLVFEGRASTSKYMSKVDAIYFYNVNSVDVISRCVGEQMVISTDSLA